MMSITTETLCIAFEGSAAIGSGRLADVALAAKKVTDRGARGPVLVFDDVSSQPIELDLRGSSGEVLARLDQADPAKLPATMEAKEEKRRRPGRPKLGVVSREVTLLPRHWAWLGEQPGGASVTIRKLVEQARRTSSGADRRRKAQESAYRFMSVMAGNEPGFEEATRALFAGDSERFFSSIEPWPSDVQEQSHRLATRAFESQSPSAPGTTPASDGRG